MRVRLEPRVAAAQKVASELEVVSRKELGRIARFLDRLRSRLLRSRWSGADGQKNGQHEHVEGTPPRDECGVPY
jgi:hypothetical protein